MLQGMLFDCADWTREPLLAEETSLFQVQFGICYVPTMHSLVGAAAAAFAVIRMQMDVDVIQVSAGKDIAATQLSKAQKRLLVFASADKKSRRLRTEENYEQQDRRGDSCCSEEDSPVHINHEDTGKSNKDTILAQIS
jgi:hypothetical protein